MDFQNKWKEFLFNESKEEYFRDLANKITSLRNVSTVYPDAKNTFAIYARVPLESLKVVILGQDPYHNGHATGVAFESLQEDLPKSLQNIFREIQTDVGGKLLTSGDLTHWTDQGVFLLNRILTVESGNAASHHSLGWEKLTERTLEFISNEKNNVVFMLWGKKPQRCRKIIDDSKHLILTSAHPSPLSARRGFFGCKHFSKCNEYLTKCGIKPIDWYLEKEQKKTIKIEEVNHDKNEQFPDFGY